MAISAMKWVMEEAPDLPAQCFAVLMVLADKAHDDGTGAFPSQKTLAAQTRKSERSVRSDLATLERAGLIRRGDQALAAAFPADRRPIVWDLAIDREDDQDGGKQASGRKHTAGRKPGSGGKQASGLGDQEELFTGGSRLPAGSTLPGGSTPPNDRKQASANPPTNRTTSPPSGESARARAASRLPNAESTSARLSVTQRSKKLTDAYAAVEPMCRWPAVNGIVIRAINAERWTDDEIGDALLRLAKEGRSVTVETLRVELDGVTPRASPSRHSGHKPYRNPENSSGYYDELKAE